MANPVRYSCPEDAWTKVATNVTSGSVTFFRTGEIYYMYTYKLTGESAPTDESVGLSVRFEALPARELKPLESSVSISHSEGIDVYVRAKNNPGTVEVSV